MLGLFLEGLAWGIVPVFFVGPVLFTLLDASLQDGFAAGARVALGIALSDVLAIALCALGLGPILAHPTGELALELVGGLLLLGFGLTLAVRAQQVAAPSGSEPRSTGRPLLAGFAVNFVNPFVFTYWIGVLGAVGASRGWTPTVLVPMFAGMVTTILVTDLLKAAAASALARHLPGPALTWARRLSGLVLAGAGLFLLLRPLLELR